MSFSSCKSRHGFTLVELVMVIAILAIIAAIAIPTVTSVISQSNQAVCATNRGLLERTYKVYLASGGTQTVKTGDPVGTFLLADDLTNTKLLKSVPKCPSGGTYTWSVDSNGIVYAVCSIHGKSEVSETVPGAFPADSITSLVGKWSITNGTLTSGGDYENRALLKNSEGTDYVITTTAVLTASQGGYRGYGVYYRTTDKDGNGKYSGYCFQVDPGQGNTFLVRKIVNGSETNPIQSVAMKDYFPNFSVQAKHDIKISVKGTSQIISVDGKEILNFSDASYASGSVGFRTWRGSTANFYSSKVTSQ